jgi:hypothetical protein
VWTFKTHRAALSVISQAKRDTLEMWQAQSTVSCGSKPGGATAVWSTRRHNVVTNLADNLNLFGKTMIAMPINAKIAPRIDRQKPQWAVFTQY